MLIPLFFSHRHRQVRHFWYRHERREMKMIEQVVGYQISKREAEKRTFCRNVNTILDFVVREIWGRPKLVRLFIFHFHTLVTVKNALFHFLDRNCERFERFTLWQDRHLCLLIRCLLVIFILDSRPMTSVWPGNMMIMLTYTKLSIDNSGINHMNQNNFVSIPSSLVIFLFKRTPF